jgi:DNA-binding protein
MYGLIQFAKKAEEVGIKPILGTWINDITDESTIVKDSVIEEIEILKEDEDIEIEELVEETAEPSTILEKLLSDE